MLRRPSGASHEPAVCQHWPMASATPPRTPCWHCRHMISVEPRSTIVQCGRPGISSPSFTRGGGEGCEAWEREPGIDDDDWDPIGVPRIAPYVPEPPALRARSRGDDGWWTEPKRPPRPPAPPRARPPAWVLPARDLFGGIFLQDDDCTARKLLRAQLCDAF